MGGMIPILPQAGGSVERLPAKNSDAKGSATLRASVHSKKPQDRHRYFAGPGQCKIDAEEKGAGRGFTVASLRVAAKVVVLAPILQIVQL
jgi:hypothetical protein